MLVYIDNYGRGKSDVAKDPSEYSLSRDVEDIEGIRKALGYEKINVLGHSYGGMVAQQYAIKYPQNVKHLILANSFWTMQIILDRILLSRHDADEVGAAMAGVMLFWTPVTLLQFTISYVTSFKDE